jgi:hypothetical protein
VTRQHPTTLPSLMSAFHPLQTLPPLHPNLPRPLQAYCKHCGAGLSPRSKSGMPERVNDEFATEGALLFKRALRECMDQLETALGGLPPTEAGVRMHGVDALKPLLAVQGSVGGIAASILGPQAKPVRAVLFNKSPHTNWSLAWHQDRTICVKERREAPGFGPWTVKSGMQHVAPPFELLERMVTLRAHLDDVPVTNAPLLIAPGSHTLGRITVSEVDEVVRRCGTRACTAEAGDVWLYATPILHASETASKPCCRRVLQVDYAAEALPNGLEWHGV